MTERDLQRILTHSVQDVHLSDEAKRRIRLAAKEERPVKAKKTIAVILAMLLALSAGVGIAAELGMFDFLSRKMGQTVLPGANDLVQTNIASGETDHVAYTIRQAAYDGRSATLLVEMRPKDDQTLLIGPSWMLEDELRWYADGIADSDSRTIAQYAADNGFTRIVEARIDFGVTVDISCIDEWNNNVMTALYSFSAEGSELVWPIEYCAYDHLTRASQRTPDSIPLKADPTPLWQVSSSESFDAPDYGLRIDGVTITGTAVQSYWEITCTVTDAEKANSFGWNSNLVDMNKQYLPNGVLGVFSWPSPERNGQQIVMPGTIAATKQPPEQLMILLRNWEDHTLNKYFPITLR